MISLLCLAVFLILIEWGYVEENVEQGALCYFVAAFYLIGAIAWAVKGG